MEKSDLVKYLFSLNGEECQEFNLYLHSPYFNRKELPIRLFEFLLPYQEAWQTDRTVAIISREAAFEAVYPGEPYVAQRLRRVRMELFHLLLEFIGFHSKPLLAPGLAREYAIRKYLLDRGHLDLYRSRVAKEEPDNVTSDFLPSNHLGEMFLELLQNEYLIHAGKPEDTLEVVAAKMDRFYLSSRLQLWTSMINKERIYNRPHHYTFMELISPMIGSEQASGWDNVQLWWNVFQLHQPAHSQDSYLFLSEFLVDKAGDLPLDQLRQIRMFMLNYITRSNESTDKYLQVWHILSTMLDEGTLYAEGKINSPLFRNTVRAACLSGNVDWAEAFLRDHGPHLKGEEREAQLSLFQAMVHFYTGHPDTALSQTQVLKFKSLRNEVYLKVLQIMCVYEIGDEKAFFRRAEAFRKYVTNTGKLGGKISRHYYGFVRLVMRLGKARFFAQRLHPGFKQEIQESKVAEKLWLLGVLEALRE